MNTNTPHPTNGDTNRDFTVDGQKIRGIGNFHKTLPRNSYGEVDQTEFLKLVAATDFDKIAPAPGNSSSPSGRFSAPLVNPRAGLAKDPLIPSSSRFTMPPAPAVQSLTIGAEMVELYWMALLRDKGFDAFPTDPEIAAAAQEIDRYFFAVTADDPTNSGQTLRPGIDVPGAVGAREGITPANLFRVGLPGEEFGPLISQFFIRKINYGAQIIDARVQPYRAGRNYLTSFRDWLNAQADGKGADGNAYPKSNEALPDYYEPDPRYIATPRDLARFVNKDALHQAYFNAALILLSGDANWTPGNPYRDPIDPKAPRREAGFGTLGGPHILALVSEVATRALEVAWYQKWQVHLRLRPEAFGGLLYVQEHGVPDSAGQLVKRAYGLDTSLLTSDALKKINALASQPGTDPFLLPLAFTGGSPAHPAYGAGHATVAGACVTILKAFFETVQGGTPIPFTQLQEPTTAGRGKAPIASYVTGVNGMGEGIRSVLDPGIASQLTIEGELNKLAANVAMGRTMGGVHWRTDNTRSLTLGEAMAAHILADISANLSAEKPTFTFRTFARKSDGQPKNVVIAGGKIEVDGVEVKQNGATVSEL